MSVVKKARYSNVLSGAQSSKKAAPTPGKKAPVLTSVAAVLDALKDGDNVKPEMVRASFNKIRGFFANPSAVVENLKHLKELLEKFHIIALTLNSNAHLVEMLISISWSDHCFKNEESPKLAETLLGLLTESVTFDLSHLEKIMKKIVCQLFLGRRDEASPEKSDLEVQVFSRVHGFCRDIISSYPQASRTVFVALKSTFPFHLTCKEHNFSCYVYNFLTTIDYSDRQDKVISFAIDRLHYMDLNCHKSKFDTRTDADVFLMEEISSQDKRVKKEAELKVIDAVLECSLDEVVKWINAYIKGTNGEIDSQRCTDIFKWFTGAFVNIVLPTDNCSRIQFVIFYICSLNETLADDFIDHLWNIFVSEAPEDIRNRAVSYLVSFMARSRKVDWDSVVSLIQLAFEWIEEYNDENCKDIQENEDYACDMHKHSQFYRLFQGIVYLIVTRSFELRDEAIRTLRVFGFQRLITSKLNPLGVFCEPLLERFATLARHYQLAFCAAVIERNKRNEKEDHVVDDVFLNLPFEPNCTAFFNSNIKPLFREGVLPMKDQNESTRRRPRNESMSDCSFGAKDTTVIWRESLIASDSEDDEDMEHFTPMELSV